MKDKPKILYQLVFPEGPIFNKIKLALENYKELLEDNWHDDRNQAISDFIDKFVELPKEEGK